MSKEVEILDHHFEIISGLILTDGKINRENTKNNVNKYVDIILRPPEYNFTEISKRKMAKAFEKAAMAMINKNYRVIPDYKDEEKTIDNFDLICFSCPNHTKERCEVGNRGRREFFKIEELFNKLLGKKNRDVGRRLGEIFDLKNPLCQDLVKR